MHTSFRCINTCLVMSNSNNFAYKSSTIFGMSPYTNGPTFLINSASCAWKLRKSRRYRTRSSRDVRSSSGSISWVISTRAGAARDGGECATGHVAGSGAGTGVLFASERCSDSVDSTTVDNCAEGAAKGQVAGDADVSES